MKTQEIGGNGVGGARGEQIGPGHGMGAALGPQTHTLFRSLNEKG